MDTSVGGLHADVGLDAGGFNRGMSQVEGRLARARGSFGKLGQVGGAFGGAVLAGAKVAGAGVALLGGVVAVAGFKFLAMREQAQIAFTTMLHSGSKAKAFLDKLQSFAARTPFEFPDLVKGSQRLLAMGFAAKDVMPTLTSVGDAVAGLGGNSETINRVVTALGQIKSKGKASAEEMMQLTEAGIPAWQMLADKIGKSVPEAMKLVTKGAISADTTIAAVTEGMNKRFGGMMEKQSHTFSGVLSTLKDTFSIVAGTVMKPFFGMAVDGMAMLADAVSGKGFQGAIASIGDGISKFVNGIKSGFDSAKSSVDTFKAGLGGGDVGMMGAGMGAGIRDFIDLIRKAAPVVRGIIGKIASFVTGKLIPAVAQIGKAVGPPVAEFIKAFAPMAPFFENILIPVFIGLAKSILGTFVIALKIATPVIRLIATVLGQLGTWAAPIKPLFEALGMVIGFMFPGAALKAVGAVLGLATKLGLFGKVLGTIGLFVAKFVSIVNGLFAKFASFVGGLVLRLGAKVVGAIVGMVSRAVGAYVGFYARVIGIVANLVIRVVGFFVGLASKVPGVITGLVGKVTSKLSGLASSAGAAAAAIGRAIMQGIINGVKNMLGTAISSIKDAAGSLVDAGKSVLGIGSPSMVFAKKVGEPIPEGIAYGINKNRGAIDKALGGTLGALPGGAIGAGLGGGGGGITWTGDLIVQGQVVTERELVATVRNGLEQIARQNGKQLFVRKALA